MSTVKANEYRHLNNSGTEPNLTLSNNASVEVGNDLTIPQGNIDVTGNATISGNITANGNASLGNAATDAHTIAGTLSVTKLITATEGVKGDVKDTGGNTVVDVGTGNNATFDGDLTGNVKGDVLSPNGTTVLNNGTGAGTNSTFTGTADAATHVQVTDNESTDENNLITFVEGAAATSGQHGLEMDGNLTYNPSSGTVSATAFSGSGTSLTGLNAANLSSGIMPIARIGSNAITSGKLKNYVAASGQDPAVDGAVVTSVISNDAVTTDKLDSGAVTNAKLASNAVTAAKIADFVAADSQNNITQVDAVTTAKINDGAVTAAKIAGSAVTTAKIADGDVTTAKVAAANVTYAKIQNVANARILGNNSGNAASVSELTGATVTSMLSNFAYDSGTPANSTKGLVPKPGTSGDNAKFLRGDGTWAMPPDTDTDTTYTAGSGLSLSNTNQFSVTGTFTSGITVQGKNIGTGGNTSVFFCDTVNSNAYDTVAIGRNALSHNTGNSHSKVAVGAEALRYGQGSYSTAVGAMALATTNSTSGAEQTALGYQAGYFSNGGNNLFLGRNAGVDVTGPGGRATTTSNRVYVGRNSITNAYIKVAWTTGSDVRDKTDIEDFSHGLDFVKTLRPVTYRWDNRSNYLTGDEPEDFDINSVTRDGSKKAPQIEVGLIAQEVLAEENKIGYATDENNDLFVRVHGTPESYGMNYERLTIPLINAVKELSAQVEELTTRIVALEG